VEELSVRLQRSRRVTSHDVGIKDAGHNPAVASARRAFCRVDEGFAGPSPKKRPGVWALEGSSDHPLTTHGVPRHERLVFRLHLNGAGPRRAGAEGRLGTRSHEGLLPGPVVGAAGRGGSGRARQQPGLHAERADAAAQVRARAPARSCGRAGADGGPTGDVCADVGHMDATYDVFAGHLC
jgi:hypothetical protein